MSDTTPKVKKPAVNEMDHIIPDLRGLAVPIQGLNLDPKNARLHGERNLDVIEESLRRFGQYQPIIVQKEGMVVRVGNGRLRVLRDRMKKKYVAAIITDADNVDAVAMAIADNRSGELATWDKAVLQELMSQTKDIESLKLFTADEMNALFGRPKTVGATAVDDAPEPDEKRIVAKAGDVWHLGDHRLMCGDSTSQTDVDRLLDGQKASLCATDPPYLVDYTGERPNDSGKDWTDKYREIDIKDAAKFFMDLFANVKRVLAPQAAIYCWHAHKRCGDIQAAWKALDILDHQSIVWVKPTPVFGRVFWHFRHEPCMMGWLKGSKPEHDGDHSMEMNSVWELGWEGGKNRLVGNEHPTQKPVEIFARPMRKHTKPGEICFEPFSGSGSQIIAGEQEGRCVRAMEISPVFVDVAIRRWQAFTGREAECEGVTFAEVERGMQQED